MLIMWFDLGSNLGMSIGDSADGQIPRSEQIRIRKRGETLEDSGDRLARLTNSICASKASRPHLIGYSAWMPMFNPNDNRAGGRSVRFNPGSIDTSRFLAGVVRGIAAIHDIRCEALHDATARSHFTGTARWGSRERSKVATRDQAALLGYVDPLCTEFDRTDSLAFWECAAYRFGGRFFKPPPLSKDHFAEADLAAAQEEEEPE